MATLARLALAERGGFEPPVQVSLYDGLANRCFRPLSHLSGWGESSHIDSILKPTAQQLPQTTILYLGSAGLQATANPFGGGSAWQAAVPHLAWPAGTPGGEARGTARGHRRVL